MRFTSCIILCEGEKQDMNKSKMLFIGQKELYDVFSNYSPELLDFQKFYGSIQQIDNDINEDNFDLDTCCFIVSSSLFHTEESDFTDFVARISDMVVVNILLIGNDIEYKDEIEYKVREQQKVNNTTGCPVYFINYDANMMDNIENSLHQFVNDSVISSDVKGNVYNAIENFNTINADEEETEDDVTEEDVVENNNNTEEEQEEPEQSTRGNAEIITVTSYKGGVGKSTNALLIASGIKKFYPNKKVCIVDLDITGGQQYFLNNAPRDAKTVLNILEADTITEDVVLDTMWHSPAYDVDFLFAPKSAKNNEYLTPELYKSILLILSNHYDVILIDTNAGNVSDITEQVTYPMADKFVVVTEPTTNSLAICASLIKQELSKYSGKPYTIVNRVYSISDKGSKLIEHAYDVDSIVGIIPLRSDIIIPTYEEGRLFDVLDNPLFAEAYKNIVDTLMGEKNG